jgi:cytochrome c-type biogenesis protein CcmH
MLVFSIVVAMFLAGALMLVLPAVLRTRAPDAPGAGEAALAVHRAQWLELDRDVQAGHLDVQQLAQARAELDVRAREVVADAVAVAPKPSRRTAWALALWLPVASVSLYAWLGHPQSLQDAQQAASQHGSSPAQMQQMVATLAERLKAQPDNLEGWTMLARSYVALGRHRDAATALQRANALAPGNPDLLADLADLLGMAQGRRLAGEPARLIQQALDIDPAHRKALALAGTVAFEAQDFDAARGYWQRLLAVVPAESALAKSVRGSIADAAARAAGAGSPAAAAPVAAAVQVAPAATTAAAAPGRTVSGEVAIDPALAPKLRPGDTLFVFARAAEGPRMPLAILRREAALPLRFTLDDSMAMSPQAKLSRAASVVVGVRVSRSGQATPQPGDLVGQSDAVAPGTQGLRIVIDRVQP